MTSSPSTHVVGCIEYFDASQQVETAVEPKLLVDVNGEMELNNTPSTRIPPLQSAASGPTLFYASEALTPSPQTMGEDLTCGRLYLLPTTGFPPIIVVNVLLRR